MLVPMAQDSIHDSMESGDVGIRDGRVSGNVCASVFVVGRQANRIEAATNQIEYGCNKGEDQADQVD